MWLPNLQGFNMLNPLVIYEIAICPYPADRLTSAASVFPSPLVERGSRGEADAG